jgi:hypothetical protein
MTDEGDVSRQQGTTGDEDGSAEEEDDEDDDEELSVIEDLTAAPDSTNYVEDAAEVFGTV